MSVQPARVIVNPTAGGHSIYGEWPKITEQLNKNGLIFDYIFTEGVGHAIELAREAANTHCKYIIAVGGDGTLNEVVNGILGSPNSDNVTMGILTGGTTCSFARSVGIPIKLRESCNLVTSPKRRKIDVGIVEYMSQGNISHRYFINEADLGFGATTVEASKNFPHTFGRRINYLPHVFGAVGSLLNYKNKRISMDINNEQNDSCVCFMVVIANGPYFGGDMVIAPDAELDDGLLDMIVFGDIGKSETLKIWPMTYKGSHINNDKINGRKIRNITIKSDERILVEADGELLGENPLSFSIVPSALTIVA